MQENTALISVIVPVYKVEPYLDRCVQSILNQTYTNFELILVDDGSPDNCGAMCDTWAEKDSRIRVIHQENGGLSAARNAGIDWAFANSDSQWIMFVDSDDWIHSMCVEALLSAVVQCGCAISVCAIQDTHGEELTVDLNALGAVIWDTESFYVSKLVNATVACGKLYHKEAFRSIRYPVGKLHEDEFITYRILFEEKCIAFIEQPLYAYFQNENSITHSPWTLDRMIIYDALEERIEYLLAHSYSTAARYSAGQYLLSVSTNSKKMRNKKGTNPEIIRLYSERKKNFPKYAKMLHIDDSRDQWILAQIWPTCTYIRIYANALIKRLCRKVTMLSGDGNYEE